MVQNYVVSLIIENTNLKNEEDKNTLTQFQSLIDEVYTLMQRDECLDFVTDADDRKVFLILSSNLCQYIVPLIHDIIQIDSVYVYCGNEILQEDSIKKWSNNKGIYKEIKLICIALQTAKKHCYQNDISLSFVRADHDSSCTSLDQLEPSFMYTQLFKEIIFEIDRTEQDIKDFIEFWHRESKDNPMKLNIIDDFERDYHPKKSIWWYTSEPFAYETLNRSLRTLDTEVMKKMGFFIRDLHCQLEELNKQ